MFVKREHREAVRGLNSTHVGGAKARQMSTLLAERTLPSAGLAFSPDHTRIGIKTYRYW